MGRKKSTENPAMPATVEKMKLVRLELPAAYHRDLRIIAAKQETNMALIARKLLQDFIDQQRRAGKV
jgi:hypothetical protein